MYAERMHFHAYVYEMWIERSWGKQSPKITAPSLSQVLKVDEWGIELQGDADREFLMEGLVHGFHLVSKFDFEEVECENYSSTMDPRYRDQVEKQIHIEVEEGRYEIVGEKPKVVSALGVIPKSSGGIRLIHDASRPYGAALNDYAETEAKQKFQSLEDAVQLMTPGCYLAKVDLKSAYRYVAVHPADFEVTGLKWKFQGDRAPSYLVDKRLPFGAKYSPGIFHRLTQAVRRMMERKGYGNMIVYLDDFLVVAETKELCMKIQNVLIRLLRSLGFAIAWDKVEGPSTTLTFLGVELDSVGNELRLPAGKLAEFRDFINETAGLKRITLKRLQMLAGKLNWASSVVRGGRTYLHRILDLMKSLRHAKHKVRISPEMRADLDWWKAFLVMFNGRRAITYDKVEIGVMVDACNKAGGMICGNDWRYVEWRYDLPTVVASHINVKETAAVLLAARQWADKWQGADVLVWTDNSTTMYAVNKGTSKSAEIMVLLRELFWLSTMFGFNIRCVHVPGVKHVVVDCISRLYEDGKLMQLESIWGFRTPMFNGIWPFVFIWHMSYKSFLSLAPQILRWLGSVNPLASV